MTGYHTRARFQPSCPHATTFYKLTVLDQTSWYLGHLSTQNTDYFI